MAKSPDLQAVNITAYLPPERCLPDGDYPLRDEGGKIIGTARVKDGVMTADVPAALLAPTACDDGVTFSIATFPLIDFKADG